MSLVINKSIHIDEKEKKAIETKEDFFEEKYFKKWKNKKYYDSKDARKDAQKAFDRWMKRKYGYSDFYITGSNGQYTLNLGNFC